MNLTVKKFSNPLHVFNLKPLSLSCCLVCCSLFLFCVLPSNLSQASTKQSDIQNIEKCKKINEKIEHYTNLRRAGGTAKQMNGWLKKRNQYREKYSNHKCSKL